MHFVKPLSFKRHRFPAAMIRQAVWLYFRFSLSFRDVEELMAARVIDVSYETIRCWTIKFGSQIARRLKTLCPQLHPVGISTRSSARSGESACTCGAPSMTKARCWTSLSSAGETQKPP
ncbi:hypothetical protein BREVUG8_110029 [Brevundimonas sp. G8]|nr:hypothetical protein BREVUG8_110029 [Brevundimonas sp. G8]